MSVRVPSVSVRARVCVASVFAALLAGPAMSQSKSAVSIDWQIAATGKKLEREATLFLTDAEGKPVSDADIVVSVDMPRMAMMHRVAKKKAEPTSEVGKYTVSFVLEMAGEWAANIQVVRPEPVRVIKKFMVD